MTVRAWMLVWVAFVHCSEVAAPHRHHLHGDESRIERVIERMDRKFKKLDAHVHKHIKDIKEAEKYANTMGKTAEEHLKHLKQEAMEHISESEDKDTKALKHNLDLDEQNSEGVLSKAVDEASRAENLGDAEPSSFVDLGSASEKYNYSNIPYAGLASWLEGGAGPAPPSSFVEEGVPNSFADIGAKLKALQEKTKVELSKLQSDTAPPSSFGEDFDNGLISAEQGTNMLKRLMGPINDHLRLLRENDYTGPSSLMSDLNPKDMENGDEFERTLLKASADDERKLKEIKRKQRLIPSLIEGGSNIPNYAQGFANLNPRFVALRQKTERALARVKKELAESNYRLGKPSRDGSSFVEEGPPDSFADIDAKLKAHREKTQTELQSDTAPPSSFVEAEGRQLTPAERRRAEDMNLKEYRSDSKEVRADLGKLQDYLDQEKREHHFNPSSLLQEGQSLLPLSPQLQHAEEIEAARVEREALRRRTWQSIAADQTDVQDALQDMKKQIEEEKQDEKERIGQLRSSTP